MELVWSVRRAPLAADPPYTQSLNGGPTLCALSAGNIAAFTSLTRLTERDAAWCWRVYVCDINTPWYAHQVATSVHQVSALEWDAEGKYLLVATAAGEVSIYAGKDYLLDDWICLYTASLPAEHIIKAAFFHNGRKIVMSTDKKSEQLPCTEKFQHQRIPPSVRGFGGVAAEGALLITASGLVGALVLPAEPPGAAGAGAGAPLALPVAAESLGATRTYITCADICYGKKGHLLIAACGGERESCVRCYRACVRRAAAPAGPAPPAPHLATQPLTSFYLHQPHDRDSAGLVVRALRWCLREDTDTLLVGAETQGGSVVDAWGLTERSLPIHSLFAKPGANKTTDCFNTIEWKQQHRFRSPDARIVSLCSSKTQLCAVGAAAGAAGVPSLPYVLATFGNNTMRLLHHNLTPVCSIVLSGAGGGADAAAASAGSGGAPPPKIPKYGNSSGGVERATVSWCEISRLGGALLCLDTHSQLHLYKLPQPATDTPTPLSVQHATSLLEYSLVSGVDCLDILMTLKPAAIEPVYERLSEMFVRQPKVFQEYHYVDWLSLRASLCRLMPEGQARASDLTCLLLLHSISSQFKSLVRPAELTCDKSPLDTLARVVSEDPAPPQDIHKVLMVLEAKEFTAEPLALQSLRRLIQRVADTALAALAALPARHHAHKPHAHSYELCSDPSALNLMRELLVISRIWGLLRQQALPTFTRAPDGSDPLAALYRLLTRLAAPRGHAADALIEECAQLPAQLAIPRVWESPPRCCVAAPHGRPRPLLLEYGVEPEELRYSPEVPQLEGSTGDGDMDSVRYVHLGDRAARVRRCSRCGARALAAAHCARTHAQRAWDMRWLPACRCGGRWTLQLNT